MKELINEFKETYTKVRKARYPEEDQQRREIAVEYRMLDFVNEINGVIKTSGIDNAMLYLKSEVDYEEEILSKLK